jgi:hypothetical protein
MKTKTKKCGVFVALAAVLLVSAALVTSCPEALSFGGLKAPADPYADFVPPEGMGFIRFSIEDKTQGRGARTAMPAALYLLASDFETISVTLTSTSGANDDVIADWNGSPLSVLPDTYTIVVTGFNDEATPLAVAMGTKTGITVSAGSPSAVTVDMKEIVNGSGTGIFDFSLTGDATIASSMSLIGLTGGASSPAPITAKSGTPSLNSGYYRMELALTKTDHKSATVIEIIHIWNGHTTTYSKALALNSNLHVITYNWNDGRTGGSAYSETKSFAHGAALTNPGAGAGAPPVYNDGTADDPLELFQGWFTSASGAPNEQWAIGKLVYGPKALFARWSTTPPSPGTIPITLNFDYTGAPAGMSIAVTRAGSAFTGPIDPSDLPTLVLTVSHGTLANATYEWFHEEGATPTTSIGSTAALSVAFGTDIGQIDLEPGIHTFNVIIKPSTGTAYYYNAKVAITVGNP